MKEIWKDIKGFEHKYQVSSFGCIKSLNYNNTYKEKILIPKINKKSGILEITLNKDNKHYYYSLSRIVYETFNNIKLSKNDIVMYKDLDKTNCELNNLYIVSRGKRQEITYDNDRRYKPKYEFYNKKLSTKQISKITGIKPRIIRYRIKKLYWNIYEASEIPVAIYKKGKKNEI